MAFYTKCLKIQTKQTGKPVYGVPGEPQEEYRSNYNYMSAIWILTIFLSIQYRYPLNKLEQQRTILLNKLGYILKANILKLYIQSLYIKGAALQLQLVELFPNIADSIGYQRRINISPINKFFLYFLILQQRNKQVPYFLLLPITSIPVLAF